MSPTEELRLLSEAFASQQVAVVLHVWRTSHVRLDRDSAVGLRRAIQVEVVDYLSHRKGLDHATATAVAGGRCMTALGSTNATARRYSVTSSASLTNPT